MSALEVETLRAEIAALRHEVRRLEAMNEGLVDAGRKIVRERDDLQVRLASLGWISGSFGGSDVSRDGSGPEDVQATKEKG